MMHHCCGISLVGVFSRQASTVRGRNPLRNLIMIARSGDSKPAEPSIRRLDIPRRFPCGLVAGLGMNNSREVLVLYLKHSGATGARG